MRSVAAAIQGAGEPPPAPAYDGRCVVLVGDDREEAAHSLLIRLQDVVGPGACDTGALLNRLSADGAGANAARAALESLCSKTGRLLSTDGTAGRIPDLLDRLRRVETRLAAAADEDAARATRIADLHRDGASVAAIENERARRRMECDRWSALLRLAPEWRRLAAVRAELDLLHEFAGLPADAPLRLAALEARQTLAEAAARRTRQRVAQLERERDEVPIDDTLSALMSDVQRMGSEQAAYRSRLLELATARARLAEMERTVVEGLRRLGSGWDLTRVAATVVDAPWAADLQGWQVRFRDARLTRDHAEQALAASRQRLSCAAERVGAELRRDATADDDEGDRRWRTVWRLRAQLDDLWQVQSRAELTARALGEREASLQPEESPSWLPSILFERRLSLAAVTAAVLALWAAILGGVIFETEVAAPLAGLAVLLGLVRIGLHVRRRRIVMRDLQDSSARAHARAEIEGLRRKRDVDWARAAQLAESIRAAGSCFGLPEPIAIDAVDACEHELAVGLRADGAHTPLTAQILELLQAQDDEQNTALALSAVGDVRRGLEQEWESWRAEVALPADIDAEHGEEWLEGLQRTSAAAAEREAVRARLLTQEPKIAAWEDSARALLRRVGASPAADLCGSELAAALSGLCERVQREEERRAERARLESERRDSACRLGEVEAELARAGAELRSLLVSTKMPDVVALRLKADGFERWRSARERADGLEALIADALDGVELDAAERPQLSSGDCDRWEEERARAEARLVDLDRSLAQIAAQRRAFAAAVDAARNEAQVADLRLEREAVLAELAGVAREWQVRVVAGALLERARHEHEAMQRRELLGAASAVLAAVTAGRYTAIARAGDGFVLVDREARHVPLDGPLDEAIRRNVVLSLLLGRARRCEERASPVVLDDILSALPRDEVALVAHEIAVLARLRPTVYRVSRGRRAAVLAAVPGAVAGES